MKTAMETKQTSIWRVSGFIAFLFIAFFNAFTDLGHKIIIQNTLLKTYDDPELRIYMALVNAMILLPFILIFTPAGFLSDRFPKHLIIRVASFTAIPITLLITLCYYLGWFWPAFWLTFALAVQSAIYSPAKFGYIRELVGKEKLAPANAVVQALGIVAILGGTLIYTFAFEYFVTQSFPASTGVGERPTELLQALPFLGFFLVGGATLEFLLSWNLLNKSAPAAGLKFDWHKYVTFGYLRSNLASSWQHEGIRLSIIGTSIFWAVGQVVLVNYAPYLKEVVGETDTRVAQGLVALSGIGIVLGAALAGKISRNYIELGIIPLGALGMCIALVGIPLTVNPWMLGALSVLYGFSGGLFIVPLNSLIQYHAKEGEAGTVIAVRNFIENIFMLAFLGFAIGFAISTVPAAQVFFILAAVVFFGTLYTVYKLPQSLIRYVIQAILNRRYKVEVAGMENIPVRGGVLLLGNHVSWLDWAMLQIACPRPIRFVMTRVYYEKWFLRWILDLFNTIPIGRSGSKDALESVREALQNGEVVALFPEGHISHNGHLSVFKSGFERGVQGTDAVIIPFYLRGLWGSRFSYVNSKYREISRGGSVRGINVGFGKPMPADTPAERVKQGVAETSIDTWQEYVHSLPPLPHAFINTAKHNLGRIASIDQNGTLTYGRLLTAILAFKGKLKPWLANQPNIGLLLPSSSGAAIANFAVLMQGKTPVNLNYTAPVEVVKRSVEFAEVKTILTSRLFLKKLEQQRKQDFMPLGEVAELVFLEDVKKDLSKGALISALLQAKFLPASLLKALHLPPIDMQDTAAILFSSGSEGTPKGIMLTHANLMANIKQIAGILNAGDEDVLLNSLPVFHAFGLTATTLFPLIEGVPMVCQADPTDAPAVGRLVAQHKVTVLFGTSTFLRIYARNRKLNALMFDSLRLVVAGAERLDPKVRQAFQDKFHKIIYEGYGTTENSPVTNCNLPDTLLSYTGDVQVANKVGTVGLPIPGTRIKIVDPDSLEELPIGEAGLVLIAGPQVMKGYLKAPEKTADVIVEQDGLRWYKTGDKGKLDADGFLTIVDRYSRFAKIGGEMISLSSVEAAIQEQIEDPDIEILAVAIPDAQKGEKIVLMVMGAEQGAIAELQKQVRDSGINPLMQPAQWLSVAQIPKLGSGKADFTNAKKQVLALLELI